MGKKIAFLGIDMGTTGIRTILSDARGKILSVFTGNVLSSTVVSSDDKVSEQDPKYWKSALLDILQRALASIGAYELRAIAVDSTSGTIIPIDKRGQPLYRALMHNDVRAQEEARFIFKNIGMNVKPSFALSKILWIKNNKPTLFEKAITLSMPPII
jgi:sugar (pentulose or hexulose) kinase